jgi:hypothetical protein
MTGDAARVPGCAPSQAPQVAQSLRLPASAEAGQTNSPGMTGSSGVRTRNVRSPILSAISRSAGVSADAMHSCEIASRWRASDGGVVACAVLDAGGPEEGIRHVVGPDLLGADRQPGPARVRAFRVLRHRPQRARHRAARISVNHGSPPPPSWASSAGRAPCPLAPFHGCSRSRTRRAPCRRTGSPSRTTGRSPRRLGATSRPSRR